MRKKIYLLLAVIILFTVNNYAQNQIVVQNGSNISFYTNLDSAIVHSDNFDTIYIPGGNWYAISQPINKRLHIFGVGHNPDSTLITGNTMINGNFILVDGASYGSLSGIYLSGNFYFGTNNSDSHVNNYSVARCYIAGGGIISFSSYPTNNIFYENIFNHIQLSSAQSNYFYNNIIQCCVYDIGNNNIFKNNIFLANGGPVLGLATGGGNVQYSIFENNVFKASAYATTFWWPVVNFNVFNNNLLVDNYIFPIGTNNGSNNIENQAPASIFVNQTGGSFNYSHDYNLQSLCPGNNAGTDGTDVGIYGGVFPWKEGSLPENPHIINKTISGNTNSNGNLNINVKVSAQNN